MKLQQNPRGLLFVSIPKAVADAVEWKRQDKIKVTILDRSTIVLKNVSIETLSN